MTRAEKEQVVVEAIRALHPNAYGVNIQEFIMQQGHRLSIGTIYSALERLEKKNLVKLREGEATPQRRGIPKLYYTLKDATP